jgi:hypothetical protein
MIKVSIIADRFLHYIRRKGAVNQNELLYLNTAYDVVEKQQTQHSIAIAALDELEDKGLIERRDIGTMPIKMIFPKGVLPKVQE